MSNSIFSKTLDNVRKHREEKVIQYKNQIITQQNLFSKNLLATEVNKATAKMNEPLYLDLPFDTSARKQCISIGAIMQNQSMETRQNYVTQTQTTTQHTSNMKMLMPILQNLFRQEFMHWTMHFLRQNTKIVIRLMKDQLGKK